MNCTDKKSKAGKIDYIFFMLLLTVYTGITFWLFVKQGYGSEELYHSDVKAYILEMQGLNSGYPFPYRFFFQFAGFFYLFLPSPEVAVATATTILNSLSLIIMKFYADKLLIPNKEQMEGNKGLYCSLMVTALVFVLFFVSMLFGVGFELPGIRGRYRGVFSPNPYHNATYVATRPFAILTFFIFERILKDYAKNPKWKDIFLFAVVLFMTTVTKPSFTFAFVPAAGLIMLFRLIQAKGKNLKNSIFLGVAFIPTFVALIYQFFGVFGPVEGQERGIGFGLGMAWSYHTGNIPLAILLGIAFPLLVLCINFKDLKEHSIFRLSWQIMAVSLFEILFLYEKGYRIGDLNFSWGYMHGMFFVFVASVFLLFQKTFGWESKIATSKSKKKTKMPIKTKRLLLLQWGMLGIHLLWGLVYFKSLLTGGLYY